MNLRNIPTITAATLLASALIFITSSPVHSQPVVVSGHFDSEIQRIVPYGDLNLVSPVGQSRLVRRVGYAVDDLCTANETHRPVKEQLDVRGCSKAAWDSVRPQITAALEQAKSGAYVASAALIVTAEP